MDNLDEIRGQNRCLLFFFREINKSKIVDCLNHLGSALERFHVSIYE
jgi:hypothetical protein